MNPILKSSNQKVSHSSNPVNTTAQPKVRGNMIQKFLAFAEEYQGDPIADLQGMLDRGEVSKAEYEAAYKKAKQIQSVVMPLLKKG